MTITLSVPHPEPQLQPKITVIGVGGAGGNAVNNMINSQLEGVEFVAANTDAQALCQSLADRKIQLGHNITHGLGAGSRPDIGRAAAEEAIDEIMEQLQGTNMVFVTAGMGGGTGTGAAPVIAKLAREHGILTVGVVTRPFQFEGMNRMRIAEAGIEEMQQYSDTLIVIPNQNLFRVANERTTFAEAFAMADQVLHSGVRGVTDLMVVPGLINLDFADIRSVMSEMGKAMMGTGEGEGEERARLAAEAAISNPLLDEVSMRGARGVLINITGGPDMTLFEVDEAANRIGEEVENDSNIIFGSTLDPNFEGRMRVSVVATGIDAETASGSRPVLRVYTRPDAPERPAGTGATENRADTAPETVTAEAPARNAEREAAPGPNAAERGEPAEDAAPAMTGDAADEAADPPFIPPRPVEARRDALETRAADPFAEADLVNGGEPPRRPSLLQRMTAGALARRDAAEEAGSVTPPPPPIPEHRSEPEQPLLSGVAKPEQTPVKTSEEDLLDIPAFLRRQAN